MNAMSEVSDKSLEQSLDQDRELRRRNVGSGDDKLNFEENSDSKNDNNLSPADSENEQRLGSDVRKKNIDFFLHFTIAL